MDRMNLWRGACAALALAAGLVAAPAGAQVQYIHTDALGSVVAVTDANRNVIERREFAPYGDQLNAPAADRGPGYTGHVEDGLTGLTYMQQRYYDPSIGRFLSVDPVGPLSDPVNHFGRYHYAANNPYRYTDPDGRYFESAIEIASIGVGAYSLKQNIAAGNTGAAVLDGVGIALDAVMLAIPIAPGGVGLGIKAARAADSVGETASAASKGADFIVTSDGVAVHASQSQMEASLQGAGMAATELVDDAGAAVGRSYDLPNGVTARAMEPSGIAPRRTSFDNANGAPVTPTGTVPQPPRGSTRAERVDYVRQRTHVEQRE